MARVYHRDQPGAPAFPYAQQAGNVAQFIYLKTILKACLVAGYQGAPAAGWSLEAEGDRFVVLRNGTKSGYVCLSWAGGIVTVYLAATFTGMNGDVMTGDGLKSGVRSGLTGAQRLNLYYNLGYRDSASWRLIADEKTFLLGVHGQFTQTPVELTAAPNQSCGFELYVGEDSEGNFLSVGGASGSFSTSTSSCFCADSGSGNSGGITVLRDPSTGLLVDTAAIDVSTPGYIFNLSVSGSSAESSIVKLGEVSLSRFVWTGKGVPGGNLRGVAGCPALYLRSFASYAAQCLGRSTPMTTRQIAEPLDLGDGNLYFVRNGYYYTPFFLVTDNPEFW